MPALVTASSISARRSALLRRHGSNVLSSRRYVVARAAAANHDRGLQASDSWCAVFINLARRSDRREKLASTLASTNSALMARLERIEAVDGKNIDLEDCSLLDVITDEALSRARRAKAAGAVTIVHRGGQLVKFHDHFTEGGIACAKSHRKALQFVASHPTADWGLILEDDVCEVVPDVLQSISHLLKRLPHNWDSVFLGYHGGALAGTDSVGKEVEADHLRAMFELQVDEMRGPVDGFRGCVDADFNTLSDDGVCTPPVLRMYMPLYGLYAWMIRKEAARAVLDGAFPVSGQVDYALSNWLVKERGRSFRVPPKHMLFFSPKSEENLDSDIQSMTAWDDLVENPEACERYFNFIRAEDAHASLDDREVFDS